MCSYWSVACVLFGLCYALSFVCVMCGSQFALWVLSGRCCSSGLACAMCMSAGVTSQEAFVCVQKMMSNPDMLACLEASDIAPL